VLRPCTLSLCRSYVRPILSQQRSQPSAAHLPARPYHSPKLAGQPAQCRSVHRRDGAECDHSAQHGMAWHGMAWHGMAANANPSAQCRQQCNGATVEAREAIGCSGYREPCRCTARGRIGRHEAARRMDCAHARYSEYSSGYSECSLTRGIPTYTRRSSALTWIARTAGSGAMSRGAGRDGWRSRRGLTIRVG
jgi:hypothetical protein